MCVLCVFVTFCHIVFVCCVLPGRVLSCLVWSCIDCLVLTCLVWPCLALSGLAWYCLVLSCRIVPHRVLSCLVWSGLVLVCVACRVLFVVWHALLCLAVLGAAARMASLHLQASGADAIERLPTGVGCRHLMPSAAHTTLLVQLLLQSPPLNEIHHQRRTAASAGWWTGVGCRRSWGCVGRLEVDVA